MVVGSVPPAPPDFMRPPDAPSSCQRTGRFWGVRPFGAQAIQPVFPPLIRGTDGYPRVPPESYPFLPYKERPPRSTSGGVAGKPPDHATPPPHTHNRGSDRVVPVTHIAGTQAGSGLTPGRTVSLQRSLFRSTDSPASAISLAKGSSQSVERGLYRTPLRSEGNSTPSSYNAQTWRAPRCPRKKPSS